MPRRIRAVLIGSASLLVAGVLLWALVLGGRGSPIGAAPRAACHGSAARGAAGSACGAAARPSGRAVAAAGPGRLTPVGTQGVARTGVPPHTTAGHAAGAAEGVGARSVSQPPGARPSAASRLPAAHERPSATVAAPSAAHARRPVGASASGTRLPAPAVAPRPQPASTAPSAPSATPARGGRAASAPRGESAVPRAATQTLGVLVVGLAGGAPVASAAVLLPPGHAEVVPLAATGAAGGGASVLRAYASRGLGGAQAAAQSLLGAPVPYGVVVDLAALSGAVDAIGGMPYDLPSPVRFQDAALGIRLHLAAGPRQLDGAQTLALLRWCADGFGTGSPDCAGQRFAAAVVERLLHPPVAAIPRLLGLMQPAIRTDMGLGALMRLAAAVLAGHRALTVAATPT